MKILNNILETIGNTPVVVLNRVTDGCPARILAKLEMFNPSASAKARAALGMILEAEESGVLKPGSVIVEPTSGNQGIALAMVGAVRGYRVTVVMPESMSVERRMLAEAYGAEVILTPKEGSVAGAVKKAREIVAATRNAWMPDQFANPANPRFHEKTTAMEILTQVDGPIHALVAGVGTGGTLTGIARALKKYYPGLKVYAVEPENSAVLAGKPPGEHMLEGIGDGFVPANLDMSLVEAPVAVSDQEAVLMTRRLACEEGILAGISSGAAVAAAVRVGREMGRGKTVVVVLPDTGERYLSTPVFRKR
ncbi:MAG: cysteine synthase A [Firmicutes bacterium]|nr:cysteine synthase A [Bacillota bacterium]